MSCHCPVCVFVTLDKRLLTYLLILQALRYDEGSVRHSRESSQYINCELTISEFADALGLQPDSMFVTSMFKMVDKSDNGYISFREFLDFFIIFHKGLHHFS